MSGTGRRPSFLVVMALSTVLVLAGAPSVAAAVPPANDELSGATTISVPSTTTQDTSAATANTEDPQCFASASRLGATVWFMFTTAADEYGTYYIDTFGSDYDTTVALYSPGQAEVYCTYDSKGTKQTYLEAPVYPGTTYFLLIGSATEETAGGTLVLNITDQAPPPPPVPPNDEIANATEIASLPFRGAFDASLATWAESDPVPYGDFLCYGAWSNSVWYQYTPSADTYVQLDTFGSEFRNTLTVYTGTTGGLIQVTDCDVDGGTPDEYAPWVEFAATAGTTYYILMTAYPTEPAGFLVLNARETVPFTIDVRVEPNWLVNARHHYVTARVTVTCSKFGYIGLTGQLTQVSKNRNAFGSFLEPVTCSDQMPREFVISADPDSPNQFGVGRATLHLEARGESHESVDVEIVDTTVQLRAGR